MYSGKSLVFVIVTLGVLTTVLPCDVHGQTATFTSFTQYVNGDEGSTFQDGDDHLVVTCHATITTPFMPGYYFRYRFVWTPFEYGATPFTHTSIPHLLGPNSVENNYSATDGTNTPGYGEWHVDVYIEYTQSLNPENWVVAAGPRAGHFYYDGR